jgi:hypothetical protein
MPKLLSKSEVAILIRKSVSWINQQISNAESVRKMRKYGFPCYETKVGRNVYWGEDTIMNWLKSQSITCKTNRFD